MEVRQIDAVHVLNDINWHHKPTPVSEFESGFNQGLNQAMWIITHATTLTPQNEWISAEDMLPPNMDDVLVVVRDNGECWTATGYYSSMSKVWYAVLNGQDTQMDVLWWMPFPASPDSRPPEGEET